MPIFPNIGFAARHIFIFSPIRHLKGSNYHKHIQLYHFRYQRLTFSEKLFRTRASQFLWKAEFCRWKRINRVVQFGSNINATKLMMLIYSKGLVTRPKRSTCHPTSTSKVNKREYEASPNCRNEQQGSDIWPFFCEVNQKVNRVGTRNQKEYEYATSCIYSHE